MNRVVSIPSIESPGAILIEQTWHKDAFPDREETLQSIRRISGSIYVSIPAIKAARPVEGKLCWHSKPEFDESKCRPLQTDAQLIHPMQLLFERDGDFGRDTLGRPVRLAEDTIVIGEFIFSLSAGQKVIYDGKWCLLVTCVGYSGIDGSTCEVVPQPQCGGPSVDFPVKATLKPGGWKSASLQLELEGVEEATRSTSDEEAGGPQGSHVPVASSPGAEKLMDIYMAWLRGYYDFLDVVEAKRRLLASLNVSSKKKSNLYEVYQQIGSADDADSACWELLGRPLPNFDELKRLALPGVAEDDLRRIVYADGTVSEVCDGWEEQIRSVRVMLDNFDFRPSTVEEVGKGWDHVYELMNQLYGQMEKVVREGVPESIMEKRLAEMEAAKSVRTGQSRKPDGKPHVQEPRRGKQ